MRSKRRQRRSYTRIKLFGVILSILVLIVVGAWFCGNQTGEEQNTEQASSDHIVHVMIMGVDRRDDDVGRSDTLMVASLDETQEKAALLSVPRDTRVKIEGHDYDKINHAYAYGGHELTQKTLEHLLGVPMDHYILIDPKAFERIIDAIGGVDLNVEKRMYYEDPWDDNGGLVIDLYPGEQHLNGKKAIQYVRYRDGEGDIGRVGRQQKFMKAVMAKLISPEILPKLPQVVQEISSSMETDMSVPELIQFASTVKSVHDNGLEVKMVPGKPAFLKDISYWIPDIPATRKLLVSELGFTLTAEEKKQAEKDEKEYLKSLPKDLQVVARSKSGSDDEKDEDEKPMKPEEISVMVINSSGIDGAGADVAAALQKKGFIITSVETGKVNTREQTTITTSERNTDVFYGMPFPCIIMDGGSSNQAVVNIGRDYRKKK